eukprot:3490577-Rhodomonas_salina.1
MQEGSRRGRRLPLRRVASTVGGTSHLGSDPRYHSPDRATRDVSTGHRVARLAYRVEGQGSETPPPVSRSKVQGSRAEGLRSRV